MRTKKVELEVDFIGGQDSMTLAEEKALSEFFQKKKTANTRVVKKKLNT